MNLNKTKMVAMIAGSIFILTLGFQNCSKVGVQDLSSTDTKAVGEGVPVEGGDGTIEQPDDPGTPGAPGTPTTGTPTTTTVRGTPTANNPPPKDDDDQDHVCDKDKDKDKDKDDDKDLVDVTEEMAVQLCMTAKPGSIKGPVVEKLRKSAVIESDLLTSVHDTRKLLVIKGITDAAHTGSISKHRGGPLVICNMEVDSIENTRVQVILVNSKVGSMTNHRAKPIYTINSTIGSLIDVKNSVINLSE